MRSYRDWMDDREYNTFYITPRYCSIDPPIFYEKKVHPKHIKTGLMPQPGLPGKVNRSKSKRKKK